MVWYRMEHRMGGASLVRQELNIRELSKRDNSAIDWAIDSFPPPTLFTIPLSTQIMLMNTRIIKNVELVYVGHIVPNDHVFSYFELIPAFLCYSISFNLVYFKARIDDDLDHPRYGILFFTYAAF